MDIPAIHVHTFSDKTTVGYVGFMWQTMRSLANRPESLKLSVHCIGPTACDRLKDLPSTVTYAVKNSMPEKGMSGSMAHGMCVEHALSMTDDGDIHIIADSDTVVLAKGWDDYVRIKLLDEKFGIIGTATEAIGGFSSGVSKLQMAKDIPTVAWCALSPLKIWRKLKALPRKDNNVPITTEQLSKIYNLPIGYSSFCDVAWQIPQYLFDNNVTYQAWKQLKSSKDATVLKNTNDYHEEYHIENGVPFVVHQRGSNGHAYRADNTSIGFYTPVDAYLLKEKENAPRWTWKPTEGISSEIESARQMMSEAQDAPQFESAPTGTTNGWLKAAFDGANIWSRYKTPVPKTIDVPFMPNSSCRHLRLEGTVTELHVTLPPAPDVPHTLTVRNMTMGNVTLRTMPSDHTVTVPQDKCWMVLVDIDGVIHVE